MSYSYDDVDRAERDRDNRDLHSSFENRCAELKTLAGKVRDVLITAAYHDPDDIPWIATELEGVARAYRELSSDIEAIAKELRKLDSRRKP